VIFFLFVEASCLYVNLKMFCSVRSIVDLSGKIFKCFVVIHVLLCCKEE
jgi:type III secretory pathway component EscU